MKGVALIGMPGSGKSTVGRLLAQKLGWQFIDLDVLIKEKSGRSHSEILKQDGERALLILEEKYTLDANLEDTVFSPGGSIIYSKAAIEKLKNDTRIFYLDLPFREIVTRLGEGVQDRGIVGLQSKTLEELFEERTAQYRLAAHHVFDCHGFSEKMIADGIVWLMS
jgi:shikimate kinase